MTVERANEPHGRVMPRTVVRALGRILPAGPVRVALDRLAETPPDVHDVDEFGMDRLFVNDLGPILDFFYKHYFRVDCSGIENIPASGPAILVANHGGWLPMDAIMLSYAVARYVEQDIQPRPLLEDRFFYFPYLGTILNRYGAVRACQENAQRLLADGKIIIAFPEGEKGSSKHFRARGKVQRFGRGGVIRLAMATGAPVLPVTILGPEETYPTLGRVSLLKRSFGVAQMPISPLFPWLGPLGLAPLPTKWQIRFGPPQEIPTVDDMSRADRVQIRKLNERLRQHIQAELSEMYEERKGVFR